jgi:phosphonate transport system ATP-binding protein
VVPALPAATVNRAFELLERVGIVDQIDKRADQLSGGQRQRVGIARALLQEPEILLVDEPTASLDPKTSRQVMRLLVELADEHGLAAIINIHDVALAKQFVERIVGLREGAGGLRRHARRADRAVLTEIYGEEDWSLPKRRPQGGRGRARRRRRGRGRRFSRRSIGRRRRVGREPRRRRERRRRAARAPLWRPKPSIRNPLLRYGL